MLRTVKFTKLQFWKVFNVVLRSLWRSPNLQPNNFPKVSFFFSSKETHPLVNLILGKLFYFIFLFLLLSRQKDLMRYISKSIIEDPPGLLEIQ